MLAYVLGVWILLVAITQAVNNSLWSAIVLINIGAVLFPPMADQILMRFPFLSGLRARAYLIAGLLIVLGPAFYLDGRDNRELAQRKYEQRLAFASEKDQVLERMHALIGQDDYAAAQAIASQYGFIEDSDFLSLRDSARALDEARAKRVRLANLAANARRIPTSDLQANVDAYAELARLDPANVSYKAKLQTYTENARPTLSASETRHCRSTAGHWPDIISARLHVIHGA